MCRPIGFSEATIYVWKKPFVHLGVAEMRRVRQLEDDNKRLKALVADLTLDNHMRAEALRALLRPTQRRDLADWLMQTFGVPVIRARALASFEGPPAASPYSGRLFGW